VRCVIGALSLAIQTNALIEEPFVSVPGGLSAARKLTPNLVVVDYFPGIRLPTHLPGTRLPIRPTL
jgi:hypothetical protein